MSAPPEASLLRRIRADVSERIRSGAWPPGHRPATPQELGALDLSDGADVLVLRCLHRAGGRPFALEERLINLGSVPAAELWTSPPCRPTAGC